MKGNSKQVWLLHFTFLQNLLDAERTIFLTVLFDVFFENSDWMVQLMIMNFNILRLYAEIDHVIFDNYNWWDWNTRGDYDAATIESIVDKYGVRVRCTSGKPSLICTNRLFAILSTSHLIIWDFSDNIPARLIISWIIVGRISCD